MLVGSGTPSIFPPNLVCKSNELGIGHPILFVLASAPRGFSLEISTDTTLKIEG